MKIAYFDCFAGASGDMIVAAMLDAGLEPEFLKAQLSTLGIENIDFKLTETKRAGLRARAFEPVVPQQHDHCNLKQITRIIAQSKIADKAQETAIAVFERLAHAEAAVHDKAPEDIHFHEVGALDSIIDVVSASIGLHALAIDKVYCSPISVGGGTVQCAHGSLPVPAPATAELIKDIPISAGPAQAELLTPTGAAILTTVTDQFGPLPPMRIANIGCGAGTLQSDAFPNILRLILGQSAEENQAEADTICLLETNIDDATGELIGFLTDSLLEQGALDVFATPIIMKHNRPAVHLSVLCIPADAPRFEQLVFEQGLTFGLRRQILQRTKLAREFVPVETPFGRVKIKVGSLNGKIVNAKPEFADCIAAAKKHEVPVKAVLDAANRAYRRKNAPNQ